MKQGYVLPLGTVVMVKDGRVPVMVVGRAQLFDHQGTVGYFDYAGVVYPQGVTQGNEYAFFNDEDVREVLFEGYRDGQEEEFAADYQQKVAASDYRKIRLEDL